MNKLNIQQNQKQEIINLEIIKKKLKELVDHNLIAQLESSMKNHRNPSSNSQEVRKNIILNINNIFYRDKMQKNSLRNYKVQTNIINIVYTLLLNTQMI